MNLLVDKKLIIIDFHLREGIICKFRLLWKKRINDKKKKHQKTYIIKKLRISFAGDGWENLVYSGLLYSKMEKKTKARQRDDWYTKNFQPLPSS